MTGLATDTNAPEPPDGAASASGGVWHRLAQAAPVDAGLVLLLDRFDRLDLGEIETRLDECDERMRTWAAQPENVGRPVAEAPCHRERLALGTLLERRLWWE